jgi:hypothetical protein
MVAPDNSPLCQEARIYYYDFLEGHQPEDAPTVVWRHMEGCDYCRNEILLLKETIDQADNDTQLSKANVIETAYLQLHFAYIGEPVDCQTVKPFLPLLADPDLTIRTRTPITSHVQDCLECLASVKCLQVLNLDQARLIRLSQVMAQTRQSDDEVCETAQSGVAAVAAMDFEGISASKLKHICTCPDCRDSLFQHRQAIIDRLKGRQVSGGVSVCETVAEKDLFDLCLPYGLNPAEGELTDSCSPLISHVSGCIVCLERMQELHRTVARIIERPDSGIVTCFDLGCGSDDKVDLQSEVGGQLATTTTESAESRAGRASPGKRHTTLPNLRTYLKPVIGIAAVLMIVLTVLNLRSLKATGLERVYENLAKVKNVHLRRISPQREEVIEEIWISRDLGIKMIKAKGQCVMWDIGSSKRKIKDLISGSIDVVDIDKKTTETVRNTLVGPLDLLPFSKTSSFPEDANWRLLPKDETNQVPDDIDVYEITWTSMSSNDSTVYHRWYGQVLSDKKLPVRTESYVKDAVNQEYELTTIIEISYPDTGQIRNLIAEQGL